MQNVYFKFCGVIKYLEKAASRINKRCQKYERTACERLQHSVFFISPKRKHVARTSDGSSLEKWTMHMTRICWWDHYWRSAKIAVDFSSDWLLPPGYSNSDRIIFATQIQILDCSREKYEHIMSEICGISFLMKIWIISLIPSLLIIHQAARESSIMQSIEM